MLKHPTETDRAAVPISRRFSTLELSVIGKLWKTDGLTAYGIMRDFQDSRTLYYRGGAGAIYPLLKGLVAAGLLIGQGSGRGNTRYSVTEAGVEALRSWYSPPFGLEDFACALDLIRSRTYYLEVLPAEARLEYLNQQLTGLQSLCGDVQLNIEGFRKEGDRFGLMAASGGLFETRARMEWVEWMIAQVRDEIEGAKVAGAS